MKKLVFILVLLALILTACGPSDADCDLAWDQLDVDPGEEGTTMNMAMNKNWPPDSVGFRIKECIESGWDGWR